MTERLTTLSQVKDYLEIQTDESDSFLTRLIDSASQFVLTWIGRDTFGLRSYTQNFRGTGRPSVMLFNWPVKSVTSVGIAGSAVAASPIGNLGNPSSGYVVSDVRFGQQQINLYGYNFWSGAPSQVIYSAGFQTSQTDSHSRNTVSSHHNGCRAMDRRHRGDHRRRRCGQGCCNARDRSVLGR
jgi:hypothetical protein